VSHSLLYTFRDVVSLKILWLDAKMAEHGSGKLIPPPEVLTAELAKSVEAKAPICKGRFRASLDTSSG
jgi:hypothetical protein